MVCMDIFLTNLRIFLSGRTFSHFLTFFQKKAQYDFPKMREGGVKGRLELFRKFIRFGRGRLPLLWHPFLLVTPYHQVTGTTGSSLISQWWFKTWLEQGCFVQLPLTEACGSYLYVCAPVCAPDLPHCHSPPFCAAPSDWGMSGDGRPA